VLRRFVLEEFVSTVCGDRVGPVRGTVRYAIYEEIKRLRPSAPVTLS
jgi:hypothetical protein